MKSADVVIIGAGVTGLASGYWLAKAGAKVIILDKGRIAWEASSRATGFLSLRGEQPSESPMAAEAEKIWPTLDEELGSPTEWHPRGRLWAAVNEPAWEEMQKTYQSFLNSGIPFRLISGAEAREIVPALTPRTLGGIHTTRSGHANPQRTAQAFAWAFQRLGGTIMEFSPALGIEVTAGKVTGVRVPGGTIATGTVVNCAGPQSGLIGDMVGVHIPVAAARLEATITAPIPPLFDVAMVANGLSLRQTRRGNIQFNGGPHEWIAPPLDSEPAKPNTPIVCNMSARLLELFPNLSNVQVLRTWAGVVDATPDQACIIQRLQDPEGFIVAVTSGHGFGLAPSVGKAVCDLAVAGTTEMPIGRLGLERFSMLGRDWQAVWNWNPGLYNT